MNLQEFLNSCCLLPLLAASATASASDAAMVLVAADLVLASNVYWLTIMVGVSLWGVHMGITQGLLARMIADTAPVDLRGTAYGFFNLISGIAMLISSTIAGFLWFYFSATFTFIAGGCFATLALLGIIFSSFRKR